MILVDLVFINSNGGIILARQVVEHISTLKSKNKFLILCDIRNNLSFELSKLKYEVIKNSELSRFLFYKKHHAKFEKILCFANVPPPIKINKKVFIYFHNELILNNSNSNFNYSERLIFNLKKLYIKHLNKGYFWFVQSEYMSYNLNKFLKIDFEKIILAPIYNDTISMDNSSKELASYIYPANNQKHKNIERLLLAFIEVSKEITKEIKLKITVDKNDFRVLGNSNLMNLQVEFTGNLDYGTLIEHYRKSNFLIFPSLKESFGLPLIEGVQMGCKVLAADLPYSKNIVNASIYFDPYSISDIKKAIIKSLNNPNLKQSEIRVKNSIQLIFNKYLN
jgi:hypothetical protein